MRSTTILLGTLRCENVKSISTLIAVGNTRSVCTCMMREKNPENDPKYPENDPKCNISFILMRIMILCVYRHVFKS